MASSIPKLIGAGELQRRAATILKTISQSDQEGFIVTHNVPTAVIMSIGRYAKLKALEDLELIPHRQTSPRQIRESFAKTKLYSKDFLNDLEDGLNKSSLYSK